ncbi:conserved hypothetical protein [Candidatus Zixiibacteriota bacterium]|nr:conserved hypothetical protein [candidate division Zixibacteria bacterium]
MGADKINLSRRNFFTAALGAAGLAATGRAKDYISKEYDKPDSAEKPVIYRTLGRTGLKIPIISMGVMNAAVPEVMAAAYEEGVRLFDTAESYQMGRNQEMVRRVVKTLGIRDKVIIGTKIELPRDWDHVGSAKLKDIIITRVESCLRQLQMDYVDIFYFHAVDEIAQVQNPAIKEAISTLKEQKKILFAGVTTHADMAEVMNEVARDGFYEVVEAMINFALSSDRKLFEAIKNAAASGVGIIAMKAFWGGIEKPSLENASWIKKYTAPVIASASLKWVMRNENITTNIPGFTNFEHLKQDFAVARDLEYTSEEKRFLDDQGARLGFDFCRQCRSCLASCPHDVEIPTLMRTYMYAAQYGNLLQARTTLDEIPPDNSIRNCLSCSTCLARCANDVKISRRIEFLKEIYC